MAFYFLALAFVAWLFIDSVRVYKRRQFEQALLDVLLEEVYCPLSGKGHDLEIQKAVLRCTGALADNRRSMKKRIRDVQPVAAPRAGR